MVPPFAISSSMHDHVLPVDVADNGVDHHAVVAHALFAAGRHRQVQHAGEVAGGLRVAQVRRHDDRVLQGTAAEMLRQHLEGVQVIDRHAEEPVHLFRMQRHRQDAVGARRRQQVRDQPRGNRDARRVLLVRAGIGEVRDHRRDARRRRSPRRIQHQQQLHQVLLHGRHQRLDDEHVCLPAIDFELHAQTVVAEGGDGGRAESHLQPFAEGGRQLPVRVAAEDDDLVHRRRPGESESSPNTSASNRQILAPCCPGILRQAGLAARLAEKLLAVPVPLGGHLRQQQPAAPPFLDHESVPADLDLSGAGDRFERPEERQLDHQIRRPPPGRRLGTSGRRCTRQPRTARRHPEDTDRARSDRCSRATPRPGCAATRTRRRGVRRARSARSREAVLRRHGRRRRRERCGGGAGGRSRWSSGLPI